MAKDPFKKLRRSMEQVREEFREEMDRARIEMEAAMDEARADMERAREEFEEAMRQAREAMGLEHRDKGFHRRRGEPRRRGPLGGEPAPVKPRPNPSPLTDGAEAPIE